VTRERFRNSGRLTEIIATNRLFEETGLDPLDPAHDRMMMCGSPAMLKDLVAIVRDIGFAEGNSNAPGQYVVEKAFVEK
jgi:ferredoxin--NADP+ reductase